MAQNTTRVANQQPNGSLMTGTEQFPLTATPSGNQATGLLMVDGCNEVSTVGSTNDSVKLPPAKAGMIVCVANRGANSMQVFGSGIDTINDVATATGVAVASNKHALFFATRSAISAPSASAGEWYMILTA